MGGFSWLIVTWSYNGLDSLHCRGDWCSQGGECIGLDGGTTCSVLLPWPSEKNGTASWVLWNFSLPLRCSPIVYRCSICLCRKNFKFECPDGKRLIWRSRTVDFINIRCLLSGDLLARLIGPLVLPNPAGRLHQWTQNGKGYNFVFWGDVFASQNVHLNSGLHPF